MTDLAADLMEDLVFGPGAAIVVHSTRLEQVCAGLDAMGRLADEAWAPEVLVLGENRFLTASELRAYGFLS